jgi:thymidylate kinase
MQVYFLGTDCCGKNTVMHELAKELGYRPFMSPRSPICNMVYDRIYDRNQEYEAQNLRLVSGLLRMGTYFVLIQVKTEILVKRALARNEKHVNTEEGFKKHIKMYSTVFSFCKSKFPEYSYRFIKINNDSEDLQKTVLKLKKIISESDLTRKLLKKL